MNGRLEAAQLTGVSAGNIGAVSTPGEGSEFFFVVSFPCVRVVVVGASEVSSGGSWLAPAAAHGQLKRTVCRRSRGDEPRLRTKSSVQGR